MARRFTVIQGGISDVPALETAPTADAAWRVDLYRPGDVEAGTVAAWRALMARSGVSDPLRDPDYLLPLAQHRGRRVAVALAWSRDAAGHETLRGAVPLAMPHPVWGRGAESWRTREAGLTALIDGTAADAVETALRGRLRTLRRPVRLAGSFDDGRTSAPERSALAPVRRPIPAGAFVGVRPEGWHVPEGVERVTLSEPTDVRDAVETLLALDARTARAPIIADPSEATLVRVVSRLFARRSACRVELVRRAGEVVAAALHLGLGPASVTWRRARA